MPLLHLHLHLPPLPHRRLRPSTSLFASFRPKPLKTLRHLKATSSRSPSSSSSRPPRDRVIDFGRYKGQMLGTIPPSYLRWVADELDYDDTAHWARLARAVLADPVYLDRIEWDHAHRFLRGDANYDYAYDDGASDDAPLQEMADRFGWDLADEDGWSKLDFRLLGTSFGGRIPRKGHTSPRDNRGKPKKGSLFRMGDPGAARDKREERRERMRSRREEQVRMAKMDMLGVKLHADEEQDVEKDQIRAAKKEILGLGRRGSGISGDGCGELLGRSAAGGNPFPGRQSLLNKVRKLKGSSSNN